MKPLSWIKSFFGMIREAVEIIMSPHEDVSFRVQVACVLVCVVVSVLLSIASLVWLCVVLSADDDASVGKLDGERAALVAVKVYRVGDGLSSTNVHGSAGDWLILAVPADTNDARRCISDIGNDKLIFTHGACNAVQGLSTMNLLLSGVK